jgi:hypothetical protein
VIKVATEKLFVNFEYTRRSLNPILHGKTGQ